MIVEKGERSVNLPQTQVRKLFVNRFGAPSVGQMILSDLNHFYIGVIHPGYAAQIADDVRGN